VVELAVKSSTGNSSNGGGGGGGFSSNISNVALEFFNRDGNTSVRVDCGVRVVALMCSFIVFWLSSGICSIARYFVLDTTIWWDGLAAKLDKLAVKRSAVVRSIGGGLRFSENSIQSLKVKVCPIGQSCFVVLVMSVVIIVLVAAVYVVAVIVVVVVGVIVVVCGGVGPIVVVVVSVVVVAAVDVDISKNVWKPIVACPNPIIWVVVLVQAEVWWLQKSTPMDSMVMQFHIVAAPLSQQPAQMRFGGYPPSNSRHPVAGPETTRT